MELNQALKYLEHFSLLTVGENKVPNYSWKKNETEKLTPQEFTRRFNYKGGYIKKNGDEMPATTAIGIITGYDYLEVIDVDLKVLSTAAEQRDFWDEFITLLKDNIYDFEKKFAIYKTKSEGYHILYKSKRVKGNQKVAKLKGHEEAIIETRGTGGYVFVYPDNQVSEKSYFDIDFISDKDREILFECARFYNYEQEIIPEPKKSRKKYTGNEKPSWEDYNEKTDIWDVIGGDFTVVRNLQRQYLIKRHGATSAHSGYVYKDSGCMFLFSTGTIYPAEKLITPFAAYAHKYHNGDMSAAASKLYHEGYGDRLKKVVDDQEKRIRTKKDLIEEHKINQSALDFPLEIFPEPIQNYILECHDTLNSNIDYMGCAMMWLISVCIGNSMELQVKTAWVERGSLWLCLVGKAGIGKTPSVKNMTFPLTKINGRQVKRYYKELEKWEEYNSLSKKEREDVVEVRKPVKEQFIANDITLEALVELHQESDNAVGVFKDELAGWIKDMNKYREGSDLEFWLSTWSGEAAIMNRKTAKSGFVDVPFIPVLGGIQPSIFSQFSTQENKENGFTDRLLLCYPDAKVENYNEREMDEDIIHWYKERITAFHSKMKQNVIRDDEGQIQPQRLTFSEKAKEVWVNAFNAITAQENDDEQNEYLKSMYPKQKSYIPRFALLLHIFDLFFENNLSEIRPISEQSMKKAIRLSDYFVANAQKIKINSTEIGDYKKVIDENAKKSIKEQVLAIHKANSDFNRTEVANLLGVSRMTVMRHLKDEV